MLFSLSILPKNHKHFIVRSRILLAHSKWTQYWHFLINFITKIYRLQDVGRLHIFELVFVTQNEETFSLISYKLMFHEYHSNVTCATHSLPGIWWCTKPWALTIRPKFPKFSKRGQMVRKFPGKRSRKFGNCWISEKRTIQPKIPEIFWNYANSHFFNSKLVLWATITARWTSHARKVGTSIQKWTNILVWNLATCLSVL